MTDIGTKTLCIYSLIIVIALLAKGSLKCVKSSGKEWKWSLLIPVALYLINSI